VNVVQVEIIEESGTSVLFTFCIEETGVFRGNSWEARAGVSVCVVDGIGCVCYFCKWILWGCYVGNLIFFWEGVWFWCAFYWKIILKVKEWLQNLGIGDHTPMVNDDDDADDETIPLHHDESAKNRSQLTHLCNC